MGKRDKYYDEEEVIVSEFKCKKCNHEWRELVERDEIPECPECESGKVKRKS